MKDETFQLCDVLTQSGARQHSLEKIRVEIEGKVARTENALSSSLAKEGETFSYVVKYP